ncbi:hypothetical protein [Peribacillus butanolivorans]|uniref:hypothetical protein n=1 Tax=Peribacillus butanolivorans TaxID=421767 RepID=UPI0035D88EAD
MKKIILKIIGLVLGIIAIISCIKSSEYLMNNRIPGLPIGIFIAASIRQLTDKIINCRIHKIHN